MLPTKPYLDSSHKLILTFDVDGAGGPTAVVSPASSEEHSGSGP